MKTHKLPNFCVSNRLRSLSRLVTLSLVLFPACRHSAPQQEQSIVINAPATGVVRTVLVEEGEGVDKDAVILQIAVPAEREVSPPATRNRSERQMLRAWLWLPPRIWRVTPRAMWRGLSRSSKADSHRNRSSTKLGCKLRTHRSNCVSLEKN